MSEFMDEERKRLAAEAQVLIDSAGPEGLSGAELARFEEIEGLIAENQNRTRMYEDVTRAQAAGHLEPAVPEVTAYFPGGDPWDLQRDYAASSPDQVRSSARRAIERVPGIEPEARERAERLVLDDPDGLNLASRWTIATSNPKYESAFRKWVRDPRLGVAMFDEDEKRAYVEVERIRTAMSLTDANGGFLVPFSLDPSIVLTNSGSLNPFRQISRIETITTDTWNGVSSAGVTANWVPELQELTDDSPTFVQPTITVQKAAAYLTASIEVTQDSNISAQIAALIGDAKANLEATAFATGSGTNQPYGIVTELQLVTASRVAGTSGAAGAADFVIADVYAVDNDLPARARMGGASWVAHRAILNKCRRFGETVTGNAAFWADFGVGFPSTLLGMPAYEASSMDSTIVSGSSDDILVLGDFKKYAIVDRVGLAIAYNPMVVGATYGRPTGAVGWFAFWRVGARVLDANAFRMLRV